MAPIARMLIQPPADLFSSRTPTPPSSTTPPTTTAPPTPDPAEPTRRPHPAPPGLSPAKPKHQVEPGQEGQRRKAEPRGNSSYNYNYNYNDYYNDDYNEDKNVSDELRPPQPAPWLQNIQSARAQGHAPRPEQTDALARAAHEFYTQGLERQRQMRARRRLVVLLYVLLLTAGVGFAGWWVWGRVCGSERGL